MWKFVNLSKNILKIWENCTNTDPKNLDKNKTTHLKSGQNLKSGISKNKMSLSTNCFKATKLIEFVFVSLADNNTLQTMITNYFFFKKEC